MQHEITTSHKLLNANGNLVESGWARNLLCSYSRDQVKANKLRLKEWDYYLITNGHIGVALTIADNGYMGMDSISFLNFDEVWEITTSPMRIMPMGKTGLPSSSKKGDVSVEGKDYALTFKNDGSKRVLSFYMDDFQDKKRIQGEFVLTDEPDESMVICTPFNKDRHFYYNQKINCMKVCGSVKLGEDEFNLDDAYAVLDWGRGVWTYHNTWYWGSASGEIAGVPFGWNIGYGFGDTSAASENLLFYNGKVHKLDQVEFQIPDDEAGLMKPWKISSNDGRFEMDFVPVIDRAALTDFKFLKSDQHQVFGHFTGKVVLDDGSELIVKDFFGFAEKVENKW